MTGGAPGTPVQYVSAATYNAQGQAIELVNDSGVNAITRQYVYASNTLRLSVLRAGKTAPDGDLQQLTYTYDNAGNVLSQVDDRNQGQRQCFTYDWLDRLTGAFTGDASCSAYSPVGVGAYNHTYSYDAIGNLTSYAGNGYTYGAVNDQPHAVRTAFGNSYGYDGNGNQVSRTLGGVTYTLVFDAANRLTEVRQAAVVLASFVYAADGSRVKGTVGGVTTVYVAGLYEQSGAGSTSYYQGGAMRRSGYPDGNGVFYLLQDQLKSTSVIVGQGGAEAARQFFYPYGGNRGGAALSDLTARRFTGQYHEQALPGAEGLSFYNARWYDPQLGRFASADTIVPNANNPQDLNRYSYARNNPAKYDDPSGHCPRPPAGMGTTICMALFIKPASISAGFWELHGDNRGFLPDSDPGASRGYIWISLDTGEVQTHMNPSGYFTDYRNVTRIDKSTNTIQNDVVKEYSFYEPSQKNKWSVTRQKGGQITVQYDLVVSGPLDKSGAAPHINGTVSFWPRKDGTVDYSFTRDGFPSAEAYLYTPNPNKGGGNTGTWQVIFQDPAVWGNPYDLFGIEPNLSVAKQLSAFFQSFGAGRRQPSISNRSSR